jgi:hypothetical protein
MNRSERERYFCESGASTGVLKANNGGENLELHGKG